MWEACVSNIDDEASVQDDNVNCETDESRGSLSAQRQPGFSLSQPPGVFSPTCIMFYLSCQFEPHLLLLLFLHHILSYSLRVEQQMLN